MVCACMILQVDSMGRGLRLGLYKKLTNDDFNEPDTMRVKYTVYTV